MTQLQIPFSDIIEILEKKKQKRLKFLGLKSGFNEEQKLFLLKITYDLTDKDFEFLISFLLEKEGYSVTTFGKYHKGIDIEANRNGKKLYIQCKQFAKAYITDKQAGEFCGQLNKTLKTANQNESFYYVTTSYITQDARDVFFQNNINIISNKELLDKCQRTGLFENEGWKDVIEYIREKRIQELIKNRDMKSTNYEEIKKQLRTQRIQEFKHHLPPSIRNTKSFISYIEHRGFINTFFKDWNLT